ncbi:response regulator [Bacteroidales bacterium]|nr:response regulator [Bacteroidales bacterium]
MKTKLLFILLTFCYSAIAQNYAFESITANDGLSQNYINYIHQDAQGFMWFATNDGLDRYDGYEFKTYRFNADNGNGLNSNLINHITEDKYRNIWVATADRGVNVIRYTDEQIINISIPHQDSNLLEKENIHHIYIDDDLVFILAKETIFIVRITPTGYEPIKIEDQYYIDTEAFANYKIQKISTNNYILGTSNSIKHITINPNNNFKSTSNYIKRWVNVTDIKAIGDGFLTSCSGRILYINNTLNTHQAMGRHVNCLLVDNDSMIWAGSNNGLYQMYFNKETKKLKVKQHFTVANTQGKLASNDIISIYKDNFGILWLGTIENGITKLIRKGNKFKLYRDNTSNINLKQNGITCFFEDSQQNLLIGTNKEGINMFPSTISDYNTIPIDINLSKNVFFNVSCFHELSINNKQYIIVGTNYPINHQIYHSDYTESKGLALNQTLNNIIHPISAMVSDQQYLWISSHEGGLYRHDLISNDFSLFRKHNTPSLKSNRINSLFKDSKNRLWIGTNKGLHMLTPNEQSLPNPNFIVFNHSKKAPNSISNNFVVPIIESKLGKIWCGTIGGGLNQYIDSNNTFLRITTKDGLPNNSIKGIVEDDKGRLWVSTNQGICCYDPNTKQALNFNTSDGLQNQEFNSLSSAKRANGEILFGGNKGFNTFFPNKISIDSTSPDIVFTALQIAGPLESKVKHLNRANLLAYTNTTTPIKLHYNENSFTAFFSALHYFAPQKINYKYRLIGFEEKWNNINSKSRFAKYTNLHPGNYELQVLATNSDGIWNTNPLKIKIKISKPWYTTILAFLLYTTILITIFVFFNRYSLIQNSIKQSLLMERFEKEKEKELTQTKLRFFTNISHELRTPLTIIKSYFDDVTPNWDKQPKEKINKDFSIIQKNINNLLRLVSQILDFRKLEHDKMELSPTKGNIIDFTNNIIESFRIVAANKSINIDFNNHTDCLNLWFDIDKMEKILNNLISNAIKYTPEGGKVIIDITELSNEVKIKIQDNGIGIPQEAQPSIFERFYQVKNTATINSSGIGLSLTKGLIELHNAKIELSSTEGQGSSFILTFKKGNNHFGPTTDYKINYRSQQIALPHESKPTNKKNTHNNFSDKSILIVEDNDDLRLFLENKLNSIFSITTANDGKAGFTICEELMPDLIISDVMMPKMNGYELCDTIKNNEHLCHIPIILLTAKTADESKIQGYKLGADAYVNKPFNLDVLIAQIIAMLQTRENVRQKIANNPFYKNADITFNARDEEFLNKVTSVIESHMADPNFKVETLATSYKISQDNLNLKLKALTGKTSVRYIRFIRLRKAAELLRSIDSRVSEVTYEVGYSDLQHFRQHFKKEFSLSPSEYKKKHTNNN